MMLADIFVNSLFRVLNELCAVAINRPRTRADIVPISPITRLRVLLESTLKCCSGRVARSDMPSTAPPNTHANTIQLTFIGLTNISSALELPCLDEPLWHSVRTPFQLSD